jgi:hypothetical protein
MGRRPLSNTRAPNATTASVIAVALATSAGGCSFIFSEGAPDDHRTRATFVCGESHVPPILDTVGAGLLALSAVGAQSAKEKDVANAAAMGKDPVQTRHDINVQIGLAAAFAAVDVASAIYGYHAVGSCNEAQELRLAEAARARWLPPPYGVPPFGEPPPLWPPRLPAPYAAPPIAPPAAPPAIEAPAPEAPRAPAPEAPATPSP